MKFLVIMGLIMFLGSIFLIAANYDKVIVDRNGSLVNMRIEYLPQSCIGSKFRYIVRFRYENESFEKQIRGNFCQEHSIGELIQMKYLKGYKTILRPGESSDLQLISFGILGMVGLLISITQWRKSNFQSKESHR